MAARARFDRDYYATLEVPPGATPEEIRRSYRRLALRWHPDRNAGDPAAAEHFKEISEAYAVLVDADKRRAYDGARAQGAPGAWQPHREDLFRDLFADARASAVFEELARELTRMGFRVDARDFRDTLFGGRAVVRGTVVVVSPFGALTMLGRLARAALRGARAAEPPPPAMPRPSGALGLLARAGRWLLGLPPSSTPARVEDVVLPLRLAANEAARGGRRRVAIPVAGGTEDVLVTVPAGVRTGTRLRLRGKGAPRAGGGRGDAYLAVEVLAGD